MFKKMSLRLAFTYGLIFLISIASLDGLLIWNYSKSQYEKNEEKYLNKAEMISFMKDYAELDEDSLRYLLTKQSDDFHERILFLDNSGKVLVDSYGIYNEEILNNNEIRNTIKNKNSNIGYYNYNKKKMMMITFPIIVEKDIEYIILFSTYVEEIKDNVKNFSKLVIMISLIISLFFTTLSFFTSKKIVGPIRTLTLASEKIQKGDLDTKVSIAREDEIGLLAATFNNMSDELYKIDCNRKNFVSSVSHEFKTPLAAIRVLIESLDEEDDKETYIEYMNDIYEETNRLSTMVNSLLSLTRVDEIKLEKESIDLKAEINDIYKLLRPIATGKNIELQNLCMNNFIIEGDKNCIKEIFINLVDNAIKYGNQNGLVKVETIIDENRKILRVIDNGKGINKKDLPCIFDNFYTADKSRSFENKGSGIGLHIVKKLVKLHGWEISVKSTLGEGTIFEIKI